MSRWNWQTGGTAMMIVGVTWAVIGVVGAGWWMTAAAVWLSVGFVLTSAAPGDDDDSADMALDAGDLEGGGRD